MRRLRIAVLSLACTALLAIPGPGSQIRLPGAIAAHSGIGLTASGGRMYAAYWTKNGQRPWPLIVVVVDSSTGKVLARTQVEASAPLESRNGKVIPPDASLYLSPRGTFLLCVDHDSGVAWTLKASDLQIFSRAALTRNAVVLGFTGTGFVRTFLARKDRLNGEVRSVEVIDREIRSLGKAVERHAVEFKEPALEFVSPSSGDAIWVLDAKRSRSGNARVSAYSLDNGRLLSVWEMPNAQVESGAPVFSLAPKGHELPAPTGATFVGDPKASQAPQIAQLEPVGEGAALVDLDQPALSGRQWSRVARFEVGSADFSLSKVLPNCNLHLDVVGPSSRIAVGHCDRIGRTLFDEYAVKSSRAVIVSVASGEILATVPLNRGWDALALSADDEVDPAVVGIYDHQNEVRLVRVPLPRRSSVCGSRNTPSR